MQQHQSSAAAQAAPAWYLARGDKQYGPLGNRELLLLAERGEQARRPVVAAGLVVMEARARNRRSHGRGRGKKGSNWRRSCLTSFARRGRSSSSRRRSGKREAGVAKAKPEAPAARRVAKVPRHRRLSLARVLCVVRA